MRHLIALGAAVVLCVVAAPTWADWYEGDSYKMHFPQLPDPFGWDIEIFTPQHEVADDWKCTETGTVDDIHFWYSVQDDAQTKFDVVHVGLYKDVPATAGGPPYSSPGELLWDRTFDRSQFTIVDPYGTGQQGFADPQLGTAGWGYPDHKTFQQVNIVDIADPFVQQEGEVYWLGLWVDWQGIQAPVGWKTSQNHFLDDAVYRNADDGGWVELIDPQGVSLNMAFVITSIPEPSTLLLMLFGTAGVAFSIRRR